jgi:hypothetical protein
MSGDLMTELNPFVISHHLWGFFQHGLHDDARRTFKGEKRQDGFNIWRILTLEINSQTDCRRHGIRTRVQNPPQAADNQSLKKALASWQETYNEYIDAGGPPMDFEERRTQLLKILPKTLRLELFKNLRDYTSIPQIKEWIRLETEYEQEWEASDAAARGNRKALNALEPGPEGEQEMPSPEDMQALMTLGPESTLAEILAVQNRMQRYNPRQQRGAARPDRGAGGKFQPRAAPTGGAQGAGGQSALKCLNCGGAHYASDSKEAKRDLKARPCFKCGEARSHTQRLPMWCSRWRQHSRHPHCGGWGHHAVRALRHDGAPRRRGHTSEVGGWASYTSFG